jgi:hypothetical protein
VGGDDECGHIRAQGLAKYSVTVCAVALVDSVEPPGIFSPTAPETGMSLASDTREAVRAHPFIYEGVRAGILNYSAAARYLGVGDTDAVVAALRRYAEELPEPPETDRDLRVTMHSGVDPTDDPAEALLIVGDTALASDGGDATAVVANGDVDADLLATVLGQCSAADIHVEAAAVGEDTLVLVVGRRDGPNVVRLVEANAE